jgi:hypothetical protein
VLAAVVLPAAAMAADSLSFANGDAQATFGANDIVRIDGSITYASDCPKPGINDFFYPATDVYLVWAGSEGGKLEDAGGGRPNTIISGASLFSDEVIGLTAPGGKLAAGVYDVVYDTCQDGQYDPGRDTIFHDAVKVFLPLQLPDSGGAIGAMKDQARREYYSWLATRLAMNGLFKLADKAINLQCDIGNPIGCAMKELDYFSGIKERFMTLLLSESNHYLAIAEDPPDANYQTLTTLDPPDVPAGHDDSELANETADALGPLDREAALNAALLHAVERYQGAQAAGDGEWALLHARQARNLVAALRAVSSSTSDSLDALRNTVAANAADLDQAITRGRTFVNRVWNSGLTPDERRTLRNEGRTDNQIAAIETELRSYANSEGSNVDTASLLAALDESRAAHADTAAALDASYAKWNDIVTTIEGGKIPDTHPAVAAGGPYTAGEGGTVQLAGSSSGAVDSTGWDLDGDGSFDDASGLTPSVSFSKAGTYVVALLATHDGRSSVSYAVVKVGDTNQAPVISAPSPAERSATIVVGDPRTFSISASDPNPVSYSWLVDGAATGQTASSFAFAPVAAQVGAHRIEVVASDGTVSGGATRQVVGRRGRSAQRGPRRLDGNVRLRRDRPGGSSDGERAARQRHRRRLRHRHAGRAAGRPDRLDVVVGLEPQWLDRSRPGPPDARARTVRDPGLRRRRLGRERRRGGVCRACERRDAGLGLQRVGRARTRLPRKWAEHASVAAVGRRWRGPAVRGDPDHRERRPRRCAAGRRQRNQLGRQHAKAGRRRLDRQLPPLPRQRPHVRRRPAVDRCALRRGRLRRELRSHERRDGQGLGADALRRRQLDPDRAVPRAAVARRRQRAPGLVRQPVDADPEEGRHRPLVRRGSAVRG